MKTQQQLLKERTNKELLNDWELLNSMLQDRPTPMQINVRGWLMDEIELRFPAEFDKWIDSCSSDNDIRKYIEVA